MEQKRCSFVTIYRDFKPYLLMVLVQVGLSILYLITKASFNHGMSPCVCNLSADSSCGCDAPFCILSREVHILFSSRDGLHLHDFSLCYQSGSILISSIYISDNLINFNLFVSTIEFVIILKLCHVADNSCFLAEKLDHT